MPSRSVGAWWNPEHTYSGKRGQSEPDARARRLLLRALPEGGGGIEHMRVTYVEPGKRDRADRLARAAALRGDDGRDGRQGRAVAGGSQLTLDYEAAGFAKGGADKLAPSSTRCSAIR